MSFTIPNKLVATFPAQAKPDTVDLGILAAGFARTGVVSGCAVTAQGTPDSTVAVAAGLIIHSGVIYVVTAGSVTVGAADSTNPRFDLIVCSSVGVKSVAAGTAAANPEFPAIPANSVVLAAVYVPAADSVVNSTQIVDKRVIVSAHGAILATKLSDTTVVNTTTETVVFTGTVPGGLLAAGDILRSHLTGNILNNTGASVGMHFRLQFGATLLSSTSQVQATNVNRLKWSGTAEMVAESTTAQRFGLALPVAQATASTPFAPHTFVFGGSGVTAENTATDKAFEWRVKLDTANALAEFLVKSGFLQVFKASG